MDQITRDNLLFDQYAGLLTQSKRKIFELYCEEDFSLSEIAESLGVSRSAVYDAVRTARKQMEHFESKLSLVSQETKKIEILDHIEKRLERLSSIIRGSNRGLFPDAAISEVEYILEMIRTIKEGSNNGI